MSEVTVYCEIEAVKDRLLIKESDTTRDTSLDTAIEEASRMIDLFMKPYTTIPLEFDEDGDEGIMAIICADFAASVFKRRWRPEEAKIRGTLQPDMINDVDGTGWFAVGYKKLQEYIKSFYALEVGPTDEAPELYNQDVYMMLFKQGLLTLKEARALMSNADSAINKVINEITSIGKTETNTITTEDTKVQYHTKKQNSFNFIKSNPNSSGYKEE